MDTSNWLAIAIITATLFGPVGAVLVTRYNDARRDRRNRKLFVFRTLLRSRRMPLAQDHVAALNLVEIDFHGCDQVISKYKELIRHLNSAAGFAAEEPRDFREKSDRLKAQLLGEMGQELGYPFDKIDLYEGGYIPRSWLDQAEWDRKTRESGSEALKIFMEILMQVLESQRAEAATKVAAPTGTVPRAGPEERC